MFGLSFAKILVLAIVAAAVWLGFRYLTGLGQTAQQRQATDGKPRGRRSTPAVEAEEMTACKRCGTYVSTVKPSACSRADCPYRS
jgi:hypothetical protein